MLRSAILESTRSGRSVCKTKKLNSCIQYLHNGFPQDNSKLSSNLCQYSALANDFYEQYNQILYNSRIIISVRMQKDILFCIHEVHLGIEKCKALACSTMSWPDINRDTENTVGRCPKCNMFSSRHASEPLTPHPVPFHA